jgi:hypothetical protein
MPLYDEELVAKLREHLLGKKIAYISLAEYNTLLITFNDGTYVHFNAGSYEPELTVFLFSKENETLVEGYVQ